MTLIEMLSKRGEIPVFGNGVLERHDIYLFILQIF